MASSARMLDNLLRQTLPHGVGPPIRGPRHRAALESRALKEAKDYATEVREQWVGRRKPVTLTVAIDSRTGRSYRGRNAQGYPVPENLKRRLPVETQTNWTVENCAEVAAASRAMNDGARFDDLVMSSVHRSGSPRDPCPNCRRWVPNRSGDV